MQFLTSPFAYIIAPKESSIPAANAEQAQEELVPSDCDAWGSPSDEGRTVLQDARGLTVRCGMHGAHCQMRTHGGSPSDAGHMVTHR